MQTTDVKIVSGTYRNIEIKDAVFPLVKEYKEGKNGNFVTVDGSAVTGFPDRSIRIKVLSKDDFELLEDGESVASAETAKVETDDQIIERLRERFSILEDMTYAACDGVVRGMVVTGPPGVGKSFGVEQVLKDAGIMKKLSHDSLRRFGVEKGAATPIGLYQLLYDYSAPGSVLVLDDCDSVLYDELSLNLLKAALDSGKNRTLSWRSESRALANNGVPDTFDFKGSIIFITNVKFERTRGKLKDHLDAIMSRCHYLDLTLDTMRDKFLRCKQIVADGMLNEYKFGEDETKDLMDYIYTNKNKLREMSLRMVLKIADLKKMNATKWKSYAESTCMKRA
mgnify:CR=1 FL=1|tara:strand:- start:112 stop:1125 length:1014 start_codon:yes stop_codon:yes gene_type:complete